MGWFPTYARIFALVAAVTIIAGFYGYAWQGAVLALVGVIIYWQSQMLAVQEWLRSPEDPPPNVYGIWGELTAKIYMHQRRNQKIQARLQSNIEYLQDSFASIRDGVIIVDAQGAIEWCNAAVTPLLGLRHPDDVGQTLTNLLREPAFNDYFISGDYAEPLQFSATLDATRFLQVEITYFGKGERLLFVRDVSEAVRMEQIRRDFVANVSHELRTPLTVITGYLDTFLASEDLPSPRYEKPLMQMKQQAIRMENLLKDLLWLSRIESEKRTAKREMVDVAGLLKEVQEEFSSAYTDREVHLNLESREKIYGDFQELYSAASNLVGNALKYGGEGVRVDINWFQRGSECVLEVRDDGPGIDAVHIPRLTERFYRVDDSRNTATGGTGLGLAIVKHVAQSHHAKLEIDSELGVGTTFALVFEVGG